MKKLFYTMATAFLACAPTLSAQENLLGNPGFEEWTDGALQGAWIATDNITLQQETEIKQSGNYALRLETASNSDLYAIGSFTQDVAGTFQQGDVYEVSISYYTVSNGGSTMNRLRLNHQWDSYADPTEPYYQFYEMPVGQWVTRTAEVPVPNGGTSTFNFIMQTDPGTVLIVDDFSFAKTESKTPYLEVTPTSLPLKETTVGTPVELGKITIAYGNLPEGLGDGSIYLTGANDDQFQVSQADINEGQKELTVLYAPTKPSSAYGTPHQANLNIDPAGVPEFFTSIRLQGKATDATLSPHITVNRTEITFPETPAGQTKRETLLVSSTEMKEEIHAVITGSNGVFILSSNFMPVNQDNLPLHIDFQPKQAGSYEATLTLSSLDADDVTITLSGTATGDITHPDKQGDEYPLDDSHPVALLHETFDNAVHNEPLLLDGWKNIAEQNYRAWWGYDFSRATQPTDDGGTAKATLFNSLNPAQEPYEMWLYTPALDFKNAASKVFTFRVSASLISDEARTDSIELYYVEIDDNEPHGLFRQPVGGVYMPSTADDNDEWFSYHIDLGAKGNAVADTFFMAFRVSGTGGGASAASYYIDDVSFGRTDLPKIHLEQTQIAFEAQPGATATTPAMTVTTENLTEPITLTVGGTHKSRFKVVPETLPAEGGSFQVEFSSDEAGLYAAYVKLASRDAADVYLDMLVNNQHSTSVDQAPAIAQVWCTQGRIHVATPQAAQADVYALTGHRLASYPLGAGTSALPCTLQQGVYLLQLTHADGTTICRKVAVKK